MAELNVLHTFVNGFCIHDYDREGAKGRGKTRSYEDKQAVKRYVTEVIGDQVILLDKKDE